MHYKLAKKDNLWSFNLQKLASFSRFEFIFFVFYKFFVFAKKINENYYSMYCVLSSGN
jgi:hypothetical protein